MHILLHAGHAPFLRSTTTGRRAHRPGAVLPAAGTRCTAGSPAAPSRPSPNMWLHSDTSPSKDRPPKAPPQESQTAIGPQWISAFKPARKQPWGTLIGMSGCPLHALQLTLITCEGQAGQASAILGKDNRYPVGWAEQEDGPSGRDNYS